MNRKIFLKALFGASTILTMDGFAHLINAVSHNTQDHKMSNELCTYGAIHLNNTSLKKATEFWTKIVGMKLRKTTEKMAEFGTENQTLVIVHEAAKKKFKKGYSGLYHFAIHAPNKAAFASMVNRLNVRRYAYSPVDHTMSKSIYLDDPDGINIEFTLETPEEFKRVVTTGGLRIEGADGVIRSASERLDVNEVLKALKDKNVDNIIDEDSYIGHIHLYANNVPNSNVFYKQLGYQQFNYLPQFMYADLGGGGDYQHRIAMNSWHGQNRPLAPSENAGLKFFQINFNDKAKLKKAIANVSNYEEKDGGYWLKDPTGNQIFMTENV